MHASPNSGYPEAALAGILNCRFGGPHDYFGETVYKPFIGDNPRPLDSRDMRVAIRVNRGAELLMILLMIGMYFVVIQWFIEILLKDFNEYKKTQVRLN